MKPLRRKSRQRERIYEFIQSRMDHPAAQHVYEALKKEMPSISLGNVYRNIKILVEEALNITTPYRDCIIILFAIRAI
jgi:Fur family peroxide stress response transcriptional regulator